MDKNFDCVEMKRKGAEHVRTLTAGMTREQLIAFWAKQSKRSPEQPAAKDAKAPGDQQPHRRSA